MGGDERDEVGISQEEHQLQHAAREVLQLARRRRSGRDGRGRLDGRRLRRQRRSRRDRKGRRQAPDRRMPVDILHRDRWQVSLFPGARAEAGHHQRVSTQVIEEVAIDRHLVHLHDVSQDVREQPLRRRVALPIRRRVRINQVIDGNLGRIRRYVGLGSHQSAASMPAGSGTRQADWPSHSGSGEPKEVSPSASSRSLP